MKKVLKWTALILGAALLLTVGAPIVLAAIAAIIGVIAAVVAFCGWWIIAMVVIVAIPITIGVLIGRKHK